MAIENRELTAGTRLVARYKGQGYACAVVATGEGLRYQLADGREFKSPSAAGSAVMGGVACNGWRFWSVEGEAPEPKAEAEPQSTGKAKASRIIKRVPNQQGVPEGQVRYFCDTCMKSFFAPAGEEPQACPVGHGSADTEETAVTA